MQIWAGSEIPARATRSTAQCRLQATNVIAAAHAFQPPKRRSEATSRGRIGKHRILRLKPQLFMTAAAKPSPRRCASTSSTSTL